MKELVEVIAKSLVENPDEVVVTETEKDDRLTLVIIIKLKMLILRKDLRLMMINLLRNHFMKSIL